MDVIMDNLLLNVGFQRNHLVLRRLCRRCHLEKGLNGLEVLHALLLELLRQVRLEGKQGARE